MPGSPPDAGRAAVPPDALHSLMLHKRWADRELLETTRRLPRLARWTIGRIIVAIVRHFHTVDSIFRAHLLGVPHGFTSANPPEPGRLDELQARASAVDDWYVEYTRDLDPGRAGEPLVVTFTDGSQQRLTRAEILLHVALHGAYHRGNVGLLLRLGGAGALPDRLTSYLREAGATPGVAG